MGAETTKGLAATAANPSSCRWLRGLDLNQRPLGYEPIAGLHALQRATARRRKNARLAPSTLAPAVGRWGQFSGRNPVADRPSARERTIGTPSGGVAPSVAPVPVTSPARL